MEIDRTEIENFVMFVRAMHEVQKLYVNPKHWGTRKRGEWEFLQERIDIHLAAITRLLTQDKTADARNEDV